VLGVETEDQLKALDPDTLEALMNVRGDRGHLKTSEGRYPSWKDEFIAEKGEGAAELILAATPK